jgi:hypothetical protein
MGAHVLLIDQDGLFNGDRLRRCSNAAQLHWPRLFLASDGFGRLEINYARIVGRAYPTFNPIPSETEMFAWIQEYAKNYLLFLYQVDGQVWGQWDTRSEMLPRYKTAVDRRSPQPPENAFIEWKRRYRVESKAFPKCLGNGSETFPCAVAVAVEKNICASPKNGDTPESDSPPMQEPSTLPGLVPPIGKRRHQKGELSPEQERWFASWWPEYWRRVAKKPAREAFRIHVTAETRFQQIMAATRAQAPEMLARPVDKRPYPATWLNGERWEDETDTASGSPSVRLLMA